MNALLWRLNAQKVYIYVYLFCELKKKTKPVQQCLETNQNKNINGSEEKQQPKHCIVFKLLKPMKEVTRCNSSAASQGTKVFVCVYVNT